MATEQQLNEITLRAAVAAVGEGKFEGVFFQTVDSTNTECKRRVAAGLQNPAVLVAAEQTAGRGRMGRSFFSPADTGLYMSVLYPAEKPLNELVLITSAAAVAVKNAVFRITGIKLGIKWVNDLYRNGLKVAGILCETVQSPEDPNRRFLTVGIGINLSTSAFPKEIADRASSLGTPVPQASLAAAILEELYPYLQNPSDSSFVGDYRASSVVLGKEVEWSRDGTAHAGRAVEITDACALVVRQADGTRVELSTQDVTVRGDFASETSNPF